MTIPTIYRAMRNNGSPEPVFETDDQSTCFLTVLPSLIDISNGASNGVDDLKFKDLVHLTEFSNGASNGAHKSALEILTDDVHDRVVEMLSVLFEYMSRQELFESMNLTNQSKNRAKYLDPLIKCGWVEQEFPNNTTHPNQRYRITEAGLRLLNILEK
ncbi:Fic family protein [Parapedobacter soli]|uniref:Fic family protein n=1 Tax=Parapedobacter soli TaxID=416955 RepID=UPI0021C9229F|nr:hypothetical protein [Parapedobacter soli]